MPDSADPLAAKLAEIKHHHRQHVSINYPAPGICVSRCSARWPCDAYRAAAGADAMLELHQQGAYTAYTESCAAHLGDILGQRECPDCRKIERTGCARCRDENGHPARPEDCRERQAISRVLLGEESGDGEG